MSVTFRGIAAQFYQHANFTGELTRNTREVKHPLRLWLVPPPLGKPRLTSQTDRKPLFLHHRGADIRCIC